MRKWFILNPDHTFLTKSDFFMNDLWGHPLNTYAKFSEKLTFLTPWYAHVSVRVRELEMLVFRKILRTHLLDNPYSFYHDLKDFTRKPVWLACLVVMSLFIYADINKNSVRFGNCTPIKLLTIPSISKRHFCSGKLLL